MRAFNFNEPVSWQAAPLAQPIPPHIADLAWRPRTPSLQATDPDVCV